MPNQAAVPLLLGTFANSLTSLELEEWALDVKTVQSWSYHKCEFSYIDTPDWKQSLQVWRQETVFDCWRAHNLWVCIEAGREIPQLYVCH